MKVLTISELLCLTRIEITEIEGALLDQLSELPEGSSERSDSLATLANVQAVLARPEFAGRARRQKEPVP